MVETNQSVLETKSLNDFEICKLIADLKSLNTYKQSGQVRVVVENGEDYYFNPIENETQALSLVLEFKVLRGYEPYDLLGFHWYIHDAHNKVHILEYDYNRVNKRISPQKAICLAIVGAYYGKIDNVGEIESLVRTTRYVLPTA
ncbi:hypothetical protein [Pseudoalteromonas luteoviolacea]|uniref:hypothetical protein n=1 Tax=Pseudoalteromonas luteoviolacea TaxID=43657 RepID=UPI00114E334C|nr:hypothetical protein [Pseudoalteromonas luteoviolacea]TQF66193.1 hypothetical protein FLM44_25560 [Pseudoalteromonas luteoviolacea]